MHRCSIYTLVDSSKQGKHCTSAVEPSFYSQSYINIVLGYENMQKTSRKRTLSQKHGDRFQVDACWLYVVYERERLSTKLYSQSGSYPYLHLHEIK